eukprot:scaffold297428_cov33-Tisochrysis_lutea.AAC.1
MTGSACSNRNGHLVTCMFCPDVQHGFPAQEGSTTHTTYKGSIYIQEIHCTQGIHYTTSHYARGALYTRGPLHTRGPLQCFTQCKGCTAYKGSTAHKGSTTYTMVASACIRLACMNA